MRRCNAASSSSTAAARGGVGVVGVEARAEGPRGGGGGTTTPARAPPPENVRRRAGLGERREIGVDARLAGLGERRETEVGVDARRRRAAASAAPVPWRAMGDGDLVVRRAAARGGEKKKPSPPRGDAFRTSATASRTADFISRRSPLLSRDRGDRGEGRRCGDRSWASLRSASSSVEQRRSSWLPFESSRTLSMLVYPTASSRDRVTPEYLVLALQLLRTRGLRQKLNMPIATIREALALRHSATLRVVQRL